MLIAYLSFVVVVLLCMSILILIFFFPPFISILFLILYDTLSLISSHPQAAYNGLHVVFVPPTVMATLPTVWLHMITKQKGRVHVHLL